MELVFDFDEGCSMTSVRFDGLDGCEPVTSVKEALGMMKIKNPAVSFSYDAMNGLYNDVSDEEYQQMLDTVKCVSSLWQHKDAPEGSSAQYEMNVLTLLSNAIELVSELNTRLRK